ncbi:hypothetical protein SAMN06296241_1931 [Salinimicrobium sediminis]|uniref:Lipoprotein n=1 Tax=Salinimicrobium sediminis TaxID=1343891 RepID=A0A285X4Z0_9FLAO|nr:hypothetical protein [Salinimicrobium sediminis]SOC80382.1 hypothetical protein SAMN06296241_1931 [Salinimicrobium sediminis]
MKKLYLIFVLPVAFMFVSCSADAMQSILDIEGEHGYDFRESRAAWKDLKKEHGNSYAYTILEQSFTGAGSETTIEVEEGKVKRRHYIAFIISDEDGSKSITDSYEEDTKKELGSHSLGAPPYTIDHLYSTCLSKYLTVNTDANEIFFETNEVGVMMLCGFVPIGCQDDCYRGIRISEFHWM